MRHPMTRYEVIGETANNRRFLVGYTPRKSRRGLLAIMQRHGDPLIDLLAIGENDQITFAMKPRIHAAIENGAVVKFTGRTQCDAENEGELPFLTLA